MYPGLENVPPKGRIMLFKMSHYHPTLQKQLSRNIKCKEAANQPDGCEQDTKRRFVQLWRLCPAQDFQPRGWAGVAIQPPLHSPDHALWCAGMCWPNRRGACFWFSPSPHPLTSQVLRTWDSFRCWWHNNKAPFLFSKRLGSSFGITPMWAY